MWCESPVRRRRLYSKQSCKLRTLTKSNVADHVSSLDKSSFLRCRGTNQGFQ